MSLRCTEQPDCSDCTEPQDVETFAMPQLAGSDETVRWLASKVPEILEAPYQPDAAAHWRLFDSLGDDRSALLREIRQIGSHRFLSWLERRGWTHAAWDRLAELDDAKTIPVLRAALEDERDWTGQMAAAEALGRFGVAAREAEPQLHRLSLEHWSSWVRTHSDHARARVLGDTTATKPTEPGASAWDPRRPVAFLGVSSSGGTDHATERKYEPWSVVLGRQRIEFESDPSHRAEVPAALHDLKLESHFPTLAGIQGWRRDLTVAQKIADGWLLGTDAGEFGGDAWWVEADGTPHHLVHANVIDAVELGGRLHLLTGLGHMGVPDGALLRVEQTSGGVGVAHGVVLPGPPHEHHVEGPRLYVATWVGVAVVGEDYDFQVLPYATRRDPPSAVSPQQLDTLARLSQAHRVGLQTCLEPLRGRTAGCSERPVPPGVGLWLDVDDAGTVTTTPLEPEEDAYGRPKSPEVAACLATLVESWSIEPTTDGWTSVGYVFELEGT